MQEAKERCREENPELYKTIYVDCYKDEKERTAHLKFGQAESFWKNTQYHDLITLGHFYEGYKLQYAEIPWKDVPIPQAKMHAKIKSGKSQNQLNKERRKQQTLEEYNQEHNKRINS